MSLALAIAVLTGLLAVWAQVLVNLRLFRRAPGPRGETPEVSILIPARDEAAGIEAAVRSACAQSVPVEVVVLDDGSTDDTPAILGRLQRELPRLRVVGGTPLPPGWAGKAWACWQLAMQHASRDWLLFIDADVRLTPDAAARALALAGAQQAEFVSAFPRQVTRTAAEALVVPLIYLILLAYLPMALIRRVALPSLSAGCGQFMLVSRRAYRAAGGHREIRASLHDGIMLARGVKAAGLGVAVFDGLDVATCRMYAGFRAVWRGFSRNAYEALGSPAALIAMVAANGGLFVLPFAMAPWALLSGSGAAAATWTAAALLALALRASLAARFGSPAWTVPATPVAVLLMIGIQLRSFLNHLTGRPVVWRGRAYPGPVAAEKE